MPRLPRSPRAFSGPALRRCPGRRSPRSRPGAPCSSRSLGSVEFDEAAYSVRVRRVAGPGSDLLEDGRATGRVRPPAYAKTGAVLAQEASTTLAVALPKAPGGRACGAFGNVAAGQAHGGGGPGVCVSGLRPGLPRGVVGAAPNVTRRAFSCSTDLPAVRRGWAARASRPEKKARWRATPQPLWLLGGKNGLLAPRGALDRRPGYVLLHRRRRRRRCWCRGCCVRRSSPRRRSTTPRTTSPVTMPSWRLRRSSWGSWWSCGPGSGSASSTSRRKGGGRMSPSWPEAARAGSARPAGQELVSK